MSKEAPSPICRYLRAQTVAIAALFLVTLLLTAAVHGSLINYWDGDAMFYASTSLGAALGGAGVGWFAGRWR